MEENEKKTDEALNEEEQGDVKLDDLEDGEGSGDGSGANEGNNQSENQPETKTGEGEKPKPKQSRGENAKYAEMRRKREEAERKAREDQIRRQAEFDVKKGMVSTDELTALGIDEVKTDDELLLVETYRKAKANGDENPELVAFKALHAKQRKDREEAQSQAAAKAQAEQEERRIVAAEQAEIRKKYGKTTGEILKAEPEFKEFFDRYGKAGAFDECYIQFHKIKGDSEKVAKKQGVFPTSGTGNSNGNAGKSETDAEFIARTKKQYGSGF